MFIELPNENSHVSGGKIQFHPSDPSIFEILTWTQHSKKNPDMYQGVVSTWKIAKYIDPERRGFKHRLGIFLIDLAVKFPTTDFELIQLERAKEFVPAQHVRRANKIGREKKGSERFENLYLHPPDPDWLVAKSDRVIPSTHTSSLARS